MDRIYTRGFRCRSTLGAARRGLGAHVGPPAAGGRARAGLSRRAAMADDRAALPTTRALRPGHELELLQGRRGALPRRWSRRSTRRAPRCCSRPTSSSSRGASIRRRRRRSSAPRARGVGCASSSTASAPTPIPAEWQQRWQAAGVQWRVFNPARGWRVLLPQRWRRLHRKLCVVDGRGLLLRRHQPARRLLRSELRQARAAALRLRRARRPARWSPTRTRR